METYLHWKCANEWTEWSDIADCTKAMTSLFNIQVRKKTKASFKLNLLDVENTPLNVIGQAVLLGF